MKQLLLASTLFVLSVPAAFAAQNPWVGTWILNHSRSDYVETSGPLIISTPAPGVMRWEEPENKFTMERKPDGSAMDVDIPSKPQRLVETVKLLHSHKVDVLGFYRWGVGQTWNR